MQLSNKVSLVIIIVLMVIFFYAGQSTNSPEQGNWKLLVELSSVITSFSTIGMFYIAYRALNNWKEETVGKLSINLAIDLEDKLGKFIQACIGTSKQIKKDQDLLLIKEIYGLCFMLRRRSYKVEAVTTIESALSSATESIRQEGVVNQHALENLNSSLNSFVTKS